MQFLATTFVLLLASTWAYGAHDRNETRQLPLISTVFYASGNGSSAFDFNYNPAYLPLTSGGAALIVRVQDLMNASVPYEVGPSKLALAMLGDLASFGKQDASAISESSVLIAPSSSLDALGCEDPRVAVDVTTGTYYLFYTSVTALPAGGAEAHLTLATCSGDPTVAADWQRLGYVFPSLAWSKSGALLVARPGAKHTGYLYFGDSTLVPGIQLATTDDLVSYTLANATAVWLPIRPDSFDSALVEAGPPPMRLTDGNYLFVYNSGRLGFPSPKPDWQTQYNVGWVIIDGDDPTRMLARCTEPLLSPDLVWEQDGLTPNVVFAEGMAHYHAAIADRTQSAGDDFLLYFGAADTSVGVAHIRVGRAVDSQGRLAYLVDLVEA